MITQGGGALPVTNSVKKRLTASTNNGTSNILTGFVIEKIVTDNQSNDATWLGISLGTSFGSPYGNALLTDTTVEHVAGGFSRITLTYTAQSQTTPPTTYTEQDSQTEAPITEHPDFSDWSAQWDDENQRFYASSSKHGIESYIVGTTTVTVRGYFTSKPSSDRANIGTIQSPGSDYTETNGWLLVGSSRSLQGIFWVKENTYLFSSKGWDTDIYSS